MDRDSGVCRGIRIEKVSDWSSNRMDDVTLTRQFVESGMLTSYHS